MTDQPGSATVTHEIRISIWEVRINTITGKPEVVCLSALTLDKGEMGPIRWMGISVIDEQCKARAVKTGKTLQEIVDELNFHIKTEGRFVPPDEEDSL